MYATEQLLDLLALTQLGVGIRGGVEAIVHAARAFVTSASLLHALVKLDFRNAFHSVRRDSIFEAVFEHFETLKHF